MKNVYKFYSLISLSALCLSGCAGTNIPLEPQAQSVEVVAPVAINAQPGLILPAQCELKGKVLETNVTPYKQKSTALSINELNLIKNKAVLLGANHVVIQHNVIVPQDNHTYVHQVIGNAYLCIPNPVSLN